MKIISFCFLFACLPIKLFAQNEDKIWVSGSSIVFTTKFEEDSVTNSLYIDSVLGWGIYYSGGNSNICDKDGNLLFSSDGMNVYHKDHHFMDGGYKLAPDKYYVGDYGFSSYSQSSIILPVGDSKYYLFTPMVTDNRYQMWKDGISKDSNYFDLFWYHVIDMKANQGMGKVVESKIPLLDNPKLSKPEMMACRHANGRDWWLLKGKYESVAFYTFLVTTHGVEYKGLQEFPRYGQDYDWDIVGQSTFSTDGSQFATVIGHRGTVNLFDFDRCTGKLSNQQAIDVPKLNGGDPEDTVSVEFMSTAGIAFSPNHKFLYIVSKYNILQYEFGQKDSASSWYHVTNLDTTYNAFWGFFNISQAVNNRLYIGNWGGLTSQMSVINKPNNKGALCEWCPKCLRFPFNYGATTPPCMPNFRLGALQGSSCDTIGKLQNTDLVIYPNPSTSSFNIFIPRDMNTQVSLVMYDMVGNVLLKQNSLLNSKQETHLRVSPLAKGCYMLKIMVDKEEWVRKVVVN